MIDGLKGNFNQPIATEYKDATVYWPAEVRGALACPLDPRFRLMFFSVFFVEDLYG